MSGIPSKLSLTCPNCGCGLNYSNVEIVQPKNEASEDESVEPPKIESTPNKTVSSDEDDDDDEPVSKSSPKALPKTAFQGFISEEIQRQREKKPGLQNSDYMRLAAKAWNKYKEKNGIKTVPVKRAISNDDDDDDSDSSSDDEPATQPSPKPPAKQKSPYQAFISQEIRRQREKKPGLQNKDYMRLAAKRWNAYKEKNGIVIQKNKES